MKPEVCKNCCAREFIEQDDAYVCAYCDTRYPKPAPIPAKETRCSDTSVSEPRSSYAYSRPAYSKTKTTKPKNKWIAFLLCFFLGYIGAHKFYEGRTVMGILYLLTFGLFYVGWIVDCFVLLFKPNPYYV